MSCWLWLSVCTWLIASTALAQGRTANFVVTGAEPSLCKVVAEHCEIWRRYHAETWLGAALPDWPAPCEVSITPDNSNGGGATSFIFHHNTAEQFSGNWVGRPDKLLDDVVPHEVMHTVLASHFGRPLPRWIDEGICTVVESPESRELQRTQLREFLSSRRGIPFNQMVALADYPPDMLPLYAQGHSVAEYLLTRGDRRRLLNFVADGLNSTNWTAAAAKHYGFRDLSAFQESWLAWFRAGSPGVEHTVERCGPVPWRIKLTPIPHRHPNNRPCRICTQPDGCANGQCAAPPAAQPYPAPPRRDFPGNAPTRPAPYVPPATPAPPYVAPPPLAPLPERKSRTLAEEAAAPTPQTRTLTEEAAVPPRKTRTLTEEVDVVLSQPSPPSTAGPNAPTTDNSVAGVAADPPATAADAAPSADAAGDPWYWDLVPYAATLAAGAAGVAVPWWGSIVWAGYRIARRRRRRREAEAEEGAGPPADSFRGAGVPLPRRDTEAVQFLRLSQSEGRDPLHDALVGRVTFDELDRLIDDERTPEEHRQFALKLRRTLEDRFNEMAPMELRYS